MTLFFTKISISQKICSSHRFESLHSTSSPNIGGAEADLALGQRGQLTPWPDLVNKVACFRTKYNSFPK